MNDPGFNESIDGAADYTWDDPRNEDIAEEEEHEKFLLDPSRWWFASTAFPLIAGTFGPIANAFNICAIAQYWREIIGSGQTQDTGQSIHDPSWLLGLNGVSVSFGVIANLSLLLNMAGRLSFSIAQPITVGGFALASLLLIGLVGAASTDSFSSGSVTLTQAYYYAAFAAGIYFLISGLMTLTIIGALAGRYPKKFELTTSQRTLMLQTISFMVYLLGGAGIYVSLEGWRYLDAVYFCTYTLLTVGLGPIYPTTHGGRSLMMPYTIGGIFAVGLIIGSIRSMLLETAKQKMRARVQAKKRRQVLSWGPSKRKAYIAKFFPEWADYGSGKERPEKVQREIEFHAMRDIQYKAQKRNRWVSLALSTMAAACLWFIGALIFFKAEYKQEWTYFDAIYFSFVVLTTVGYGDFTPSSNFGRTFFVFWSLLAVPTLTILISDMGDTVIKAISEATNTLGALTILPGESGFRQTAQSQWKRAKIIIQARLMGNDKFDPDIPNKYRSDAERERHGSTIDILHARLKDEDISSWVKHRQASDESMENLNLRFYHFILSREVYCMSLDLEIKPPKKYTYDEWAYFLRLLGQNESSKEGHKRPERNLRRDSKDEGPEVGMIMDHYGNTRPWSWLGLRSPLMSHKEECEWILQHLHMKMHQEMLRPVASHMEIPIFVPPIGISDLRTPSHLGHHQEQQQRYEQRHRDTLSIREMGPVPYQALATGEAFQRSES